MTHFMFKLSVVSSTLLILISGIAIWIGTYSKNTVMISERETERVPLYRTDTHPFLRMVDFERNLELDLVPNVPGTTSIDLWGFTHGDDKVIVRYAHDRYGALAYDLSTGDQQTIYQSPPDVDDGFTNRPNFTFSQNRSIDPTLYAIIDYSTRSMHITDVITDEQRTLYSFPEPEGRATFGPYGNNFAIAWANAGDRLAILDENGHILIMLPDGTINQRIEPTKPDTGFSRVFWIDENRLVATQSSDDELEHETVLIDLRSDELQVLPFNLRPGYVFRTDYAYDCPDTVAPWAFISTQNTRGISETLIYDLTTDRISALDVPPVLNTWASVFPMQDCEHLRVSRTVGVPDTLADVYDGNWEANWQEISIMRRDGTIIAELGVVMWASMNADLELTYVVAGEDGATVDVMRTTLDALDNPQRIATLPYIGVGFHWLEDKNYLIYQIPASQGDGGFYVYDLGEDAVIYHDDARVRDHMLYRFLHD